MGFVQGLSLGVEMLPPLVSSYYSPWVFSCSIGHQSCWRRAMLLPSFSLHLLCKDPVSKSPNVILFWGGGWFATDELGGYNSAHNNDRRDFAEVIKSRIKLRWRDDPGLSRGIQGHHKPPHKREARKSRRDWKMLSCRLCRWRKGL